MRTRILRDPATRFVLATLIVISVCVVAMRIHAHATDADVAAWGVTFDLTITIPLLYWFFVIRTRRARALTIAPVFLVCSLIATAIVPRGQQHFLRDLTRAGGAIAETLLVAGIAWRLVRVRRERALVTDAHSRIALAARTIAGEGRVADVITAEVTMFYYALFCWRKKPDEPRAMTFHERNSWATILVCILVLLAAESVGMHLLLSLWKRGAAWIWTALDVWGAIWLLGDYHALRLRASLLEGDTFHLRYGMRWSASIPLTSIASIDDVRDESEWKRRDVLRVAILDEPRWLITLREPLVAQGMAGIRKTIRAIAILPDDEASVSVLRTAHAAAVARAEHP